MTNLQQAIKLPVFEKISSYCKENNTECYVVGGYVRDFLLKRKSKDIDILVLGNGIEIAKNIARSLDEKIQVTVFKTFGTAYFKYNDFEIEFVGARKESYTSDSRNPIVESGTFKEDIDRRDFKINSMAISLHPKNFGQLIDMHNGLEDLKKKIINL